YLIKWGERGASVEATFVASYGRPVSVSVELTVSASGAQKHIRLHGKPVRRTAELMRAVPVVLFTPADLRIVQGEPQARRQFMNLAIARIAASYADDMARYRRAVLQRNQLLHEGASPNEIAPWTGRLVEAGARIAVARRSFVEALRPIAAEIHRHLSGAAESLVVEYAGDLAGSADSFDRAAEAFSRLLDRRAEHERTLGRTLVGPHRDDLLLLVGGRPLRTYGSQGQQRTAALSLKLAQATLIHQVTDEPPLLLLDDCLSELDDVRASAVLELAGEYEQIILTAAGKLPPVLARHGVRVLCLPQGCVELMADGQ
ncbi:MAG: DNA replication and repair protein RecF, partial [Armatimonadetes bacterium]|nr:DNA replication and repair protein RecF [Armatimonadota bacterium]